MKIFYNEKKVVTPTDVVNFYKELGYSTGYDIQDKTMFDYAFEGCQVYKEINESVLRDVTHCLQENPKNVITLFFKHSRTTFYFDL